MDGEGAGGQGFLVDAQAAESPGPELQGLHAELQDAFDEAVLDLQMLRAEERALAQMTGCRMRMLKTKLADAVW